MSDSYLNAQPGFLNARPSGGRPGGARGSVSRPNFLVRFWREQIVHPERYPGNLAIAWGLGFFTAGVVFARTVGRDLLVPAF